MKKFHALLIGFLVYILASCNLPTATEGATGTSVPALVYTAAAQTIEAQLTEIASQGSTENPPTAIIHPTLASIPTSTVIASATAIPTPCNRASWDPGTIDVSIPDGTVMHSGQAFTKTWRLTNSGTCTWTSAYQLVFHSGDPLGVAPGYAQALTSGSVPPGGTLDISVNLTAPVATGNYKGNWRMREPGGAYFGLGNTNGDFTVVITVGGDAVLSLNPVAGESGSITAGGSISPNVYNLGDTITDDGTQIFLSFDISTIPAGAVIKNVKFDMTQGFTIKGHPFTTLGCLYYYAHNYGALDVTDFILVPPIGGLSKLCSQTNLDLAIENDDDWISSVQTRVGTTRFQLRLQFADLVTDMNAQADMIKPGTIKLTISYKNP